MEKDISTNLDILMIENLLATYPSIRDPQLTYKLTSKKEFYDFQLPVSEGKRNIPPLTIEEIKGLSENELRDLCHSLNLDCKNQSKKQLLFNIEEAYKGNFPKEKGQLLKSQEIMKRFVSPFTLYTSFLIYHGMGTGKTCVASAIIENFKNYALNTGTLFNRALIFVKGDDIARNLVSEIIKECTKDVYDLYLLLKVSEDETSVKETTKVRRVMTAISKTYEIVTYESFLKNIFETYPDDIIKNKYSNRIIVIDESHNFRLQATKKIKLSSFGEKKTTGENLYNLLHKFLHLVENCRILLLTGTPIWDRVEEIATQVNLILTLDNQLPIGNEFRKQYITNPTSKTLNHFKEVLKGKISFLRFSETEATQYEIGITKPFFKHLICYPDIMSDFQAKAASRALSEEITIVPEKISSKSKEKTKERKAKGGEFYNIAIDAATFVFPDPDNPKEAIYGKKATDIYLTSAEKGKKSSEGQLIYGIKDKFLREEIKNNLGKYSSKFNSIIEEIKSNPNEVVFIYDKEVTGTGAILLGLCLEIHGFEWIKSASSLEKPKKNRFCVLTSSKDKTTYLSTEIRKILDKSNQPNNYQGDYLRIIIGSKKISEGITIKHVRQVHSINSPWNLPSLDQALRRALRYGSHEAFSGDQKYIKIYRHCAVQRGTKDEKGSVSYTFPNSKSSYISPIDTVDTKIYKLAEEKDIETAPIRRMLKEIAIDCALNYKRNVLSTDSPTKSARECDYMDECNFECKWFPSSKINKSKKVWNYNIDPSNIDYSTYNLYYSDEAINNLIPKIKNIFSEHFSMHINKLQKEYLDLEESEKMLLLKAINYMINNLVPITNRYGFINYLKEENNILFLSFDISSDTTYESNIYTVRPLLTDNLSFKDVLDIIFLKHDENIVSNMFEYFDKLGSKPPIISAALVFDFKSLSSMTKSLLLEHYYFNKIDSPIKNFVLDQLRGYISIIPSKEEEGISEDIIVHTIPYSEHKEASYNISIRNIEPKGLTRIYDKNTDTWKTLSDRDEELKILRKIKSKKTESTETTWSKIDSDIRGIISSRDGKFRIQRRGSGAGIVCNSMKLKYDLVDLFISDFKQLDKYPSFTSTKDETKEDMIKNIESSKLFGEFIKYKQKTNSSYEINLEDFSKDELKGLITLFLGDIKKEFLCDEAKKWFEEHNLLFKE